MAMNGANPPSVTVETAVSTATLAPNNSSTQRWDRHTFTTLNLSDWLLIYLIYIIFIISPTSVFVSRFTNQRNATTWGKLDTVQGVHSVLLHMWKVSMFLMMIDCNVLKLNTCSAVISLSSCMAIRKFKIKLESRYGNLSKHKGCDLIKYMLLFFCGLL